MTTRQMTGVGRDGLLKPPGGPLYGRPNRLAWEARRNVRMIEIGVTTTVLLAYFRAQAFIQQPEFNRGLLAASTVLGLFSALWARRRLLARAAWLETTDRWWERLDEMPHIVPFPRLQRLLSGESPIGRPRLRPAQPPREGTT